MSKQFYKLSEPAMRALSVALPLGKSAAQALQFKDNTDSSMVAQPAPKPSMAPQLKP
jgi:hypothetical protein